VQNFLKKLIIYDWAFRESEPVQCVFRSNNAESSAAVQEKRTVLLRNTNACLSLYLSFLNTHTQNRAVILFIGLSLSLYAWKMAHWSCMSRPSTPCSPLCLQRRLLTLSSRLTGEKYLHCHYSVTHTLNFLTVRELEVRLHLQNPIPGTNWCPSEPLNDQIKTSICHLQIRKFKSLRSLYFIIHKGFK